MAGLGTFDILNLRINGYDYHINLMHNKASWTDPQVAVVFDQWRELMPYVQTLASERPPLAGRFQSTGVQAGRGSSSRALRNQIAANYVSDNKNPQRPELLPVPGDQPGLRPGLYGRPDGRVSSACEGKKQGRGKASA